MAAYYNEIDPYAAQWLRNLIAAGHIATGDVDERSIINVEAADLKKYTQCHFFAGIGGWSRALRLAGWPDDRPVWTGSCPCQPFSAAGKKAGQSDERHLWPHWFRLIREYRPSRIFGEQVAAAIAYGWLDDAFNDLEGQGYACGAAVLPACSVGAPHKRDRLWFVAYSRLLGQERQEQFAEGIEQSCEGLSTLAGAEPHVDDSEGRGRGFWNAENKRQTSGAKYTPRNAGENVADTNDARSQGRDCAELPERAGEQFIRQSDTFMAYAASAGSFPAARARIHSGEEGARPWDVESQRYNWWDSEPAVGRVANGIPARSHKLRAYGNAIVPQVAAEFIKASDTAGCKE